MLAPTICRSCASMSITEVHAEMNLHFPGRSLDQPSIFAFPKLVVCLDCGLTESIMSEAELHELREFAPRAVKMSL